MNVSALRKIAFSLYCLVTLAGYSQDQRIADSLNVIYQQGQFEGEAQLELLGELAFHENRDSRLRQQYAQELIELAKKAGNENFIYTGYYQLGNALRISGDIKSAINAYFKSLEVARSMQNEDREGHSLMSIADTYSSIEDRENAVSYYKNSIELLRKTMGKLNFGIVLFNLGDELIKLNRYQEASTYLNEAATIFEEAEFEQGLVYIQGNRGVISGKTGNPDLGISELLQTIEKLNDYEDYYAASSYMIYLSEIYSEDNNMAEAISAGENALQMATDRDLKIQIRDANKALYQIYSKAGFNDKSLMALQNYYLFRDSIYNIESVEEIATLRYNADMTQKQAEVDLLSQQRSNQRIILWATGIVVLLLSTLAFAMYRRNKYVQKTKKIIEGEQARSEELLLNILPKQTAEELKEKGKVTAKKFESVSVLFTDFVGFTKYAEMLDPEKLVESMDFYYGHFDSIMEKFGLEKIKTVGDSYMCAGGLPFEDPEHAVKIVNAARDIIAFVEEAKKDRSEDTIRFDIRIGINSGPIVAGVVGTKKFAYDIWGDTVNVASRMENSSSAGKINISENTYALVKDHFECEARGEVAIKNHGKMNMYYVKGLLKESKHKEKNISFA
ncbi:MAG: adenylate/guanylate cyclase domain-containing protein [Flavobacteriaceae bacterium]|nr:adenylate/guanylate cyclase domain-containing protein [Flavobacteriaceae bacterium]